MLIARGELDQYGKPNEKTPKEWLNSYVNIPVKVEAPELVENPCKKVKTEAIQEEAETPKKDKKKKQVDSEMTNEDSFIEGEVKKEKKKKKKRNDEESANNTMTEDSIVEVKKEKKKKKKDKHSDE